MSDSRTATRGRRPPTAAAVLAWFVLGTALAAAVVVVGGYLALRSVALDEAKRDTRGHVVEAAQLVESVVGDGLLGGDPDALADVDDVVVARVLDSSVVRVKLWSADGRVLYSDLSEQIGGRYPLDDGQRALLRQGGAEVEVGDLDSPENELDRGQGELIEAYTRIRTPSGTPVLFEVYERFESVDAGARRLLSAVAPPILGGMALIVLLQAPLVWSLARRLERGHGEREALLANAIAASSHERRRVASYLHDGPVQDIAGVAYALAPVARDAARRGEDEEAGTVDDAVGRLR
jgi:signal transduction histidine kinase